MKSIPKALALWFALLAATAPLSGQTPVKPGFNLFTPEQDIELGQKSSVEVERKLPMVTDAEIERYVSAVGGRLAAGAPGPKFPYRFRVTNLSDVNAFALPGGFMYVDRGLIELVPTEGQLAGVMAHEMAHVALRHQTNQVSKAYLAQAGVGILGGALGGGNRGSASIMRAVGGLGLNALFLRFSRTAESQADIVGAQIMARAGYDPEEMAQMFELLRRQAGHDPGRLERFLSDHPAPVDRELRVRQEARSLRRAANGRPTGDLGAVKAALARQPPPVAMSRVANHSAPPGQAVPVRQADVRVAVPSGRFRSFEQKRRLFTIEFPDNWKSYEAENGFGVTIAPEGGIVGAENATPSVVYGVVVNHYDPFEGAVNGRTGARGIFRARTSLADATNDLVAQVKRSNPYLAAVAGSARSQSIAGGNAITLELAGPSPVTGQEERVRVYTRELPDEHVLYALFIAPGRDARALAPTYDRMIGSLRVNDAAAHGEAAHR